MLAAKYLGPLILAGFLVVGIWWFGSTRYDAGYAAATSAQAEKIKHTRDTLEEEKRTNEAEAQARIDAAHADAAVAAGNAGRLQQQIAAIRTELRNGARTIGISPPTGTTANMLAVVLGESVERNRALAEYADRAAAAGQLCERQYDAITTTR